MSNQIFEILFTMYAVDVISIKVEMMSHNIFNIIRCRQIIVSDFFNHLHDFLAMYWH